MQTINVITTSMQVVRNAADLIKMASVTATLRAMKASQLQTMAQKLDARLSEKLMPYNEMQDEERVAEDDDPSGMQSLGVNCQECLLQLQQSRRNIRSLQDLVERLDTKDSATEKTGEALFEAYARCIADGLDVALHAFSVALHRSGAAALQLKHFEFAAEMLSPDMKYADRERRYSWVVVVDGAGPTWCAGWRAPNA